MSIQLIQSVPRNITTQTEKQHEMKDDTTRQPAASSTDCDPDRLASMIWLCDSALTTPNALFLMR